MFTYKFAESTQALKSISLLILCGVMTASVSAYGWDNRSSDRTPNGYGNTYKESGAKRSKSYGREKSSASEQTGKSEAKTSMNSYGHRPADIFADTYASKSRGGRDYDTGRDGKPTDGRSWSYTERSHTYGSDEAKRSYKPYDRDSYGKTAKACDSPAFRSGRYYYSSRPSYKPCKYGYWAFDYGTTECKQSVYFHFGYFPYVQSVRTFRSPYISISYKSGSVRMNDGYYLSRRYEDGLDRALCDVRDAWINGRFDLLRNHVQTSSNIAVLLDGKYDYSLSADDYLDMTADAIDQIQTVSFTWQTIRERVDGSCVAFADHTYRDSSGITNTVYVSYTFSRCGDRYQIIEAGSSITRLYN